MIPIKQPYTYIGYLFCIPNQPVIYLYWIFVKVSQSTRHTPILDMCDSFPINQPFTYILCFVRACKVTYLFLCLAVDLNGLLDLGAEANWFILRKERLGQYNRRVTTTTHKNKKVLKQCWQCS